MFRWRVYFIDGSTFDSMEGNPEDVPFLLPVVVIGQRGMRERVGHPDIVEGLSFFVYRNDLEGWIGFEQETFVHDEFQRHGHLIQAYRKGWSIGEHEYREIWNRARADLGIKLQVEHD